MIDDLVVLRPPQHRDRRGSVQEFLRSSSGPALGGPELWRQVNVTATTTGAIRGVHADQRAWKLSAVAAGAATGLYVDLRPASATRARVVTVQLKPGLQVLIPPGVASGLQSVDKDTIYLYAMEHEWSADEVQIGVNPLDKPLVDLWPMRPDPDSGLISSRDLAQGSLAQALAWHTTDR